MIRLPRNVPTPILRVLLDCASDADDVDPAVIEARFFEPSLEDLWRAHRRVLVGAWIEEHPGTRPGMWWQVDAPGAPLAHRAVLGGSGRPGAVTPYRGVPYLTNVNAAAPPLLEAEAEFLRRLGLLLPGEARRLTPTDFEPEVLEVSADALLAREYA